MIYKLTQQEFDSINSLLNEGQSFGYLDADGPVVDTDDFVFYEYDINQTLIDAVAKDSNTFFTSREIVKHKVDTVEVKQTDGDTGGLAMSPKYAPTGWYQQLFELEFETSKDASIHEKDWMNRDIGWASLKFYDQNDTLITDTSPENLSVNCYRTDLEWMPSIDYMIKGGLLAQKNIPGEGLYIWVQGVIGPFGPAGEDIVGATFAEGGINMDYVNTREKVGLEGVAGTILYKDKLKSGDSLVDVPEGLGSNKIRFVVRHSAGKNHKIQCIMDIFRS
jgi:hypothetical protein